MKKIIAILFLITLACSKDFVEDVETVQQYTLEVNSEEGGTLDNQGGTFDSGTKITINAVPNQGFEFTGWSITTYGTTNPLTITLNENTNLTANFERIRYTLTVNIVGLGDVSQTLGDSKVTSTTVEYNQGRPNYPREYT